MSVPLIQVSGAKRGKTKCDWFGSLIDRVVISNILEPVIEFSKEIQNSLRPHFNFYPFLCPGYPCNKRCKEGLLLYRIFSLIHLSNKISEVLEIKWPYRDFTVLTRHPMTPLQILQHTNEVSHCFGSDCTASLSADITAKRYPGSHPRGRFVKPMLKSQRFHKHETVGN